MHKEISRRPTVSFELMPPRRPEAAPKFWAAARRLVDIHPDFVSITYGAGGGDRATSRTVITQLLTGTAVYPVAHITCVGSSQEDVSEVIDEFLDSGVRSFLALRGDPPQDNPTWSPAPHSVGSSMELVRLLRDVEARRSAADPATALRSATKPLSIGVATFPAGNPAAGTSRSQEVARLKEKQDAGADYAITQLFYEPAVYCDFVAEASAAGVRIPIVAGILPMTDPERLVRVQSLTAVSPPSTLMDALQHADPQERHRRGIEATADLAAAVLADGAPGLHLYTFNRAEPAIDVLQRLGLVDRNLGSSDPMRQSLHEK